MVPTMVRSSRTYLLLNLWGPRNGRTPRGCTYEASAWLGSSLHDDADGLVDADLARAGRNPDRQVVPAGLDELRQIEVERFGPALGVVPSWRPRSLPLRCTCVSPSTEPKCGNACLSLCSGGRANVVKCHPGPRSSWTWSTGQCRPIHFF